VMLWCQIVMLIENGWTWCAMPWDKIDMTDYFGIKRLI
jgi:hypothetical protein